MQRSTYLRFFYDRLGQAVYALRDNRLRTLLSILGIAVGIASVIAVGTVSKGGSYLIFSELKTFGLNSAWVFRDRQDKDPHRRVREGSGIDVEDYQALREDCCASVRRMSAVVHARKNLIVQAINRYSNAAVTGVDLAYSTINNDVIENGRGFRRRDVSSRRAVAILGPTTAQDLFGDGADPVGREFRIGTRKFIVIGVLQKKSRDFLASIGSAGGQDANNRILIPYTLYQQINASKDISYLFIEARTLDSAKQATAEVIEMLERRHRNTFKYSSEHMASYIATANRILNGVSIIGLVAASVSLLVGGMGIMNIMSTSVLERTLEIGLRKAIGARRIDIMAQFLIEAAIISTLGGLIGLSLGAGVSIALAALTGFPLAPSALGVLIALLVSIAVGVISGFLPARRAASLHPVVALRYE